MSAELDNALTVAAWLFVGLLAITAALTGAMVWQFFRDRKVFRLRFEEEQEQRPTRRLP